MATEHRWQLERAIAAEDAAAAAAAAARLAELAGRHPALAAVAATARHLGRGARRPGATPTRWPRPAPGWSSRPALGGRGAVPGRGGPDRRSGGGPRAARHRPRAARRSDPGRTAGELSEREREVGALVIDGLTHKEIGARLYISPKTVEQHVARLRQKLAACNRAALVAALRAHLDAA